MAKAAAKTKAEDVLPETVLASVEPPERRAEGQRLLAIFGEATGFKPKVWNGMIGFGRYDYQHPSGHSGSIFATGFAMRKAEIVFYIASGFSNFEAILAELGPHKIGKSCLYLKRLEGIDENALRKLIRAGLDDLATRWPVHPA
jgi:Domain of unknown function (DU1801)